MLSDFFEAVGSSPSTMMATAVSFGALDCPVPIQDRKPRIFRPTTSSDLQLSRGGQVEQGEHASTDHNVIE